MDSQRWHKIETILDRALALEKRSQQEEYLKKACENNRQLYQEVASILQSVREADENGFLE